MKITIDIDDKIIRDAIGSAACGYWGRETGWINRSELEIRVVEDEPDKDKPAARNLSRFDVAIGLTILATKYPHHFRDLIAGTGDAYTGDALIQCAAFGELKYG